MTTFQFGKITYTWDESTYKSYWFTSKEKNLNQGDTRFLGDRLFYVYVINDSTNTVHWAPTQKDKTIKVTSAFDGRILESKDQTNKHKWFKETVLERKND